MLFLFLFFSFMVLKTEAAPDPAVDPVVVELHYQNGVKFYKRGLYDKATEEFEKTLSLDPAHQEAKDYLAKLKDQEGQKEIVDAKMSKNAQIRNLYDEGKRLYQKHDYDEAIKVFNKVLELKSIDDFASYYKERCEIEIGRKLAREKKIEDKKRLKELKKKMQADLKEEKERKKQEHEEMLKKRKEIKEEDRQNRTSAQEERRQAHMNQALSQQEAKRATPGELKKQKEEKVQEKKTAAQEKIDQKKEERQRRLEEKQAKIDEKKKAKEEKIANLKAQREEKLKEKEDRRAAAIEAKEKAKQAKAARVESKKIEKKEVSEKKKEVQQERQNNKEIFLRGVESYSKKQYQEAITDFQTVIDAESKAARIYTNSAKRLMDKASLRLKGIGEDVTVENK